MIALLEMLYLNGEPFTPDWVIIYKLMRRYRHIILQDYKALDRASISKAWEYTHTWTSVTRSRGPAAHSSPTSIKNQSIALHKY